jgi:hypothetical protein
MWKKFFKLKGIQPGEVIFPRVGKVDFSRDDLDPQFLLKLWENDCRYLELTKEGERHFFGLHQNDVETHGRASQRDSKPTAKELCEAIKNAETLEEAKEYYNQGSQYKTVQEAYDEFVKTTHRVVSPGSVVSPKSVVSTDNHPYSQDENGQSD